MNFTKIRFVSTAAAILAAAFFVAGCGKDRLVAPDDAVIELSASSSPAGIGEAVILTVQVLEKAGSPVDRGTEVRFDVDSALATVSPREVETDENGEARTTLTSAGAGTVKITARSGSEEAVLSVQFVAPGDRTISVSSSSPISALDGESIVTATVTGNGVDGAKVTFVPSGKGTILESEVVVQNGVAATRFRANGTGVGEVTITARVEGGGAASTTLELVDVVSSVTVELSPTAITEAQAPKDVTVTITVGGAVSGSLEDVSVRITADVAGFSGSTATTVTTNADGKATATLNVTKEMVVAREDAGEIRVTAVATGFANTNATSFAVLLVN